MCDCWVDVKASCENSAVNIGRRLGKDRFMPLYSFSLTHTNTVSHNTQSQARIHTLARVHARTHACTHARTHARTYAGTHARMHARTHVCTHASTRARTHACMHACMHARSHAHTYHTDTHAYTHTAHSHMHAPTLGAEEFRLGRDLQHAVVS